MEGSVIIGMSSLTNKSIMPYLKQWAPLVYWEVINMLTAGFSQAVIGKPLHDMKPSFFVGIVDSMFFFQFG